MKSFKQFLHEKNSINRKIIVSVPQAVFKKFESMVINEGRFTKKVGKILVHKDSPHFNGGEYHGHVDMPGGKQVTYTVSGKRLHPKKFPEQVPKNIKTAIGQVIKVDSDLLESYKAYDKIEKETVLLIEFKQTKAEKIIALLEGTYSK